MEIPHQDSQWKLFRKWYFFEEIVSCNPYTHPTHRIQQMTVQFYLHVIDFDGKSRETYHAWICLRKMVIQSKVFIVASASKLAECEASHTQNWRNVRHLDLQYIIRPPPPSKGERAREAISTFKASVEKSQVTLWLQRCHVKRPYFCSWVWSKSSFLLDLFFTFSLL